jgi:hypothetical protein
LRVNTPVVALKLAEPIVGEGLPFGVKVTVPWALIVKV